MSLFIELEPLISVAGRLWTYVDPQVSRDTPEIAMHTSAFITPLFSDLSTHFKDYLTTHSLLWRSYTLCLRLWVRGNAMRTHYGNNMCIYYYNYIQVTIHTYSYLQADSSFCYHRLPRILFRTHSDVHSTDT